MNTNMKIIDDDTQINENIIKTPFIEQMKWRVTQYDNTKIIFVNTASKSPNITELDIRTDCFYIKFNSKIQLTLSQLKIYGISLDAVKSKTSTLFQEPEGAGYLEEPEEDAACLKEAINMEIYNQVLSYYGIHTQWSGIGEEIGIVNNPMLHRNFWALLTNNSVWIKHDILTSIDPDTGYFKADPNYPYIDNTGSLCIPMKFIKKLHNDYSYKHPTSIFSNMKFY